MILYCMRFDHLTAPTHIVTTKILRYFESLAELAASRNCGISIKDLPTQELME